VRESVYSFCDVAVAWTHVLAIVTDRSYYLANLLENHCTCLVAYTGARWSAFVSC
jgi:hypothetical protein